MCYVRKEGVWGGVGLRERAEEKVRLYERGVTFRDMVKSISEEDAEGDETE